MRSCPCNFQCTEARFVCSQSPICRPDFIYYLDLQIELASSSSQNPRFWADSQEIPSRLASERSILERLETHRFQVICHPVRRKLGVKLGKACLPPCPIQHLWSTLTAYCYISVTVTTHRPFAASLLSLSYIVTAASAAPFKFADNPLGNSFPNPNQQQTLDIQTQAHGSLPNGAPPATINPNTLTSLRLIAFNELFEVAFFSSLLNNMTTNATGFEFQSSSARDTALAAVTAILAQEELHALNANGALSHFNTPPIQPCQYTFPTTTYDDAIALASTFTDLVLGTLQDVSSLMGSNGDAGLIRSITSVLGQEGEQNGFFRSTSNKIPSALPFLTASTREFAFSALNQNFVVPGSCDPSNLATIDLPIFPPLSVLTQKITAKEQMLRFSLEFETGAGTPGKIWKEQMGMQYDDLSVAYINQQNLPAVQKIQNLDLTASGLTFEAIFPFQEGTFGNGLTIAVLARSGGDLTTVEGVASATVFGPGLIEVN